MDRRTTKSPTREIDRSRTFAACVRAGRAILDWNLSELAERAKVTQRAIHRIETGDVQARASTVRRINRAFEEAGIKLQSKANGFVMIVDLTTMLQSPFR